MADIKVGSVVKLKSGGPVMTVTRIADETGTKLAICKWFVNDKAEQGNFPLEALQSWE